MKAVREWPQPQTLGEMRSFLGLATYFRKFIQGFSNMVRPLTNLTRKDVPFVWDAGCQQALDDVKGALTNAPVLALPQMGPGAHRSEVVTDASGIGLGGCLIQDGHPIAYESRTMIPAERNYATGEQELLAVVHCCKVWRPYLESGEAITVVTDHQPNTYLPTQGMMSRRKARWQEYLSRFKIDWVYKPGRTNVADPLSRRPLMLILGAIVTRQQSEQDATAGADGLAQASSVLVQEIREGYENDSWLAESSNSGSLKVRNGLYFNGDNAIYVPDHKQLRLRLISEAHNPPYSGHPGIEKTLRNVLQDYWWPGLTTQVQDYVKCCSGCQRNKASNQPKAGLMQPTGVPNCRWQEVALDFIVELPQDSDGYDAIVTFTDRMSKMVHMARCRSTVTAEQAATLFFDDVWKLHGLPEKLISDRGPQFTSASWRELILKLGTNLGMSTAYHPQTDGQSERTNRTLEQYLRNYTSVNQSDWSKWLAT